MPLKFHEVQQSSARLLNWRLHRPNLQLNPVSMKTVSGHVVLFKPISLPKAAKILSKFVTVENGASHAISAYLQSASTAFDELAHLAPKSEHSKHCKLDCAKELGQETELSAEPRQSITFDISEEPYEGLDGNRKKQKKSKKRKVDVDHIGNLGDNEGNLNNRASKGEVNGYLSNGAEKNA